MNSREKEVLAKLKDLLLKREGRFKLILYGSRARGDADPDSDMNVMVIWKMEIDNQTAHFISECAWEAGFEPGIVIVPMSHSREEWEESPVRSSMLAQAIAKEGVVI